MAQPKRSGSGSFGLGTLVGAFLLFQLELIVAKSIFALVRRKSGRLDDVHVVFFS